MKIINYTRWVLVLALLLVTSAGNTSTIGIPPYNYDPTGIGAPSYPLFMDTNEAVKVTKYGSGTDSYWTLTGIGTTTSLTNGQSTYDLGRDFVRYVANFKSDGQLITSMGSTTLTNYLQIKGTLPEGAFGVTSWPDQTAQLLLSATLTGSVVDSTGALGFKTLFTGGWAANNSGLTGGSTGENLWLFASSSDFTTLLNALDPDVNNGTLTSLIASSLTIGGVSSIASIPLPGAVWLFLTGLMTFLGSRRSKSAGAGFGK